MQKKRVLNVEDNLKISKLISITLENYEVISVYNIKDALQLAAQEKFDLYLFDDNLPDGTGQELCLRIREFDAETPIIFSIGRSDLTTEQAIEIGANGLVRKFSNTFVQDLYDEVEPLLDI